MTTFYLWTCVFLVVTIAVGLVRVVRGPEPADRMAAAQLFGTTGLALILLLGAAMNEPAAADIAVVFALFAALATVAFVREAHLFQPRPEDREPPYD